MRKISVVSFFLIIALGKLGYAQLEMPRTDDDRLNQVRGLAKNALRLGDTYTALFYYDEWVRRKPDNVEALYQLAQLYEATRNYPMADTTYYRVAKAQPERYPDVYLRRAQMQMAQAKYVEAKKSLDQFKRYGKQLKDKWLLKQANELYKGCDLAIDRLDSLPNALTTLLDTSINWAHIEFSPVAWSDSVLIFGSLRENAVNFYDASDLDSARVPTRKLHKAVYSKGKWIYTGPFDGPWNAANGHVGGAAFSPDKSRLYYTVCNPDWKGRMICRIWVSELKNGSWTDGTDLGDAVNSRGYTSTQPTVGRATKTNSDVVYFASDRPGGKGQLDIWFTEYNARKKEYREAKNAGAAINTAGIEMTPFYDLTSHTIYFSTNARPTFGGLDIYSIEGERSKWSKDSIQHLGKDLNSPADDIWFSVSPNRKGGFLVSNRTGGVALLHATCCDDIYSYTFEKPVQTQAVVRVTDCNKCLDGAIVSLYMVDVETNDEFLVQRDSLSGCLANYPLVPNRNYKLVAESTGFFNSSIEFNTKNARLNDTIPVNPCLRVVPTEPIRLDGIRYDFDSAELNAEAKLAIDTGLLPILKRNSDLIIELSSHTDSRGKDDYNLKLSGRRAESVVKYCIAQGIDKRRLVAKGYGETKPIAPNEHPDGSDNPEGRALNRRTEFKIIGRLTATD